MEAVISESLFEKQKSSFDMMNKNWVFILLFSNNSNDNNNDKKKNKSYRKKYKEKIYSVIK